MIKLYILLQHPAISYNLMILISSTAIFPIIFIPFQSFVAFCILQLLSSIAIQHISNYSHLSRFKLVMNPQWNMLHPIILSSVTNFPQLSIVPFKLLMHPQYWIVLCMSSCNNTIFSSVTNPKNFPQAQRLTAWMWLDWGMTYIGKTHTHTIPFVIGF